MSVESILASSLLLALGKLASVGIQKLIDSKLIIHKGLTLYHRTSELEFAFMLSLGSGLSRTNSIVKKIKGALAKPTEFDNVIEITGRGIPYAENLNNMGIITMTATKGKIDFGRLFKEVKSETVLLKVRIRIDDDLKRLLVSSRIDQTSKHFGKDLAEANIEIALDYASLWHKIYDEYTVRDIEFTFNLEVNSISIVDQIPNSYINTIIRAAS